MRTASSPPKTQVPAPDATPLATTRRANPLAGILIACFSVLLALVLAEVALRVLPLPDLRVLSGFQAPPGAAWKDPAWGDPPDRAFRRHRIIGHEHAPGVDVAVPLAEHAGGSFRFRTNNLGLRRDADTRVEKPSAVFRVLVLGDSQTDGYVENQESFSSLLEASLAGPPQAGKRVEVLNAGVAGYSPAQELLWFGVHGAELRPDLVLAIFYPGNDAVELLDPSKPNVDMTTGHVIRPRQEDSVAESTRPMDEPRLMLLARYAVQAGPLAAPWRQLGLPGQVAELGGYPTETLVQALRTCHGCYLQSLQQAARARRDPEAMREAVGHAAAILTRLNQEVRENGGRFAVAVLPTRAQVEPSLARPSQQTVARLLGLSEADLAVDDGVSRSVFERLTAAGVLVIPLGTALEAAAAREPLYYSRDWHLNAAGHRVVAAALAHGLTELGLIP